jgi:hypothetical protein
VSLLSDDDVELVSCEDGELEPIVPSQPLSSADSPAGPAWLGGAASSVVEVVVVSAASPAGPGWLGGAATSLVAVVVGAEESSDALDDEEPPS